MRMHCIRSIQFSSNSVHAVFLAHCRSVPEGFTATLRHSQPRTGGQPRPLHPVVEVAAAAPAGSGAGARRRGGCRARFGHSQAGLRMGRLRQLARHSGAGAGGPAAEQGGDRGGERGGGERQREG
jgi:hypothetical protein